MRKLLFALAVAACMGGIGAHATAADKDPAPGHQAPGGHLISPTEAAPGSTPVSDYSGDDIWTRSTLTDDWAGRRQELYEKGFMIDG